MKTILAYLLTVQFSVSFAVAKESNVRKKTAVPVCAESVLDNAKKLFLLHYVGPEGSRNSDPTFSNVEEMPSMTSPDGKRKYKVYQTIAEIGKMGQFRIRMIYAQVGDKDVKGCILMGQEILDLSSL